MSSSGHSAGGGGTSTDGGAAAKAAAAAEAARAKMFEERHLANEHTMEYFAAGVCGIIALVSLHHWTRRLYVRLVRSHNEGKTPVLALPVVVIARKIQPFLLHRMPLFPSISHFLLVFTYIALNVVLLVTNIDLTSFATVTGNRAGWLAVGNLCVVVFLALKHTPMSPLSRTSYERLNPIHQLAGFLTIAMTIMHAVSYTTYFMSHNRASMLRRDSDVSGIVAGFAMALMGIVPLIMKTRFYEFFYVAHILTFITLIIAVAFHQPETAEKVAVMTIVAGSIWAFDRTARFVRITLNSFGNTATVHPLPDGGTRVMLSRSPFGTRAGKHVFLWLPRIKLFQTHPFSVVSVDQGRAEFVVHSRKGFSAALHAYAQQHPGASIRASADGAYGAFPSPDSSHFDKVILIAGGSGASFTFGMAGNLLQHMEQLAAEAVKKGQTPKMINVDFIWAVRGRENLTWFTPSLRAMRNHPHAPNVSVSLHVTRVPSSSSGSESESDETTVLPPDQEKIDPITTMTQHNRETETSDSPAGSQSPITASRRQHTIIMDEEKQLEAGASERPRSSDSAITDSSHEGHPLRPGRPDLGAIIDAAVKGTATDKRILIAACGPSDLMKVVRRSAARNIRSSGPGIEVHCEAFGW